MGVITDIFEVFPELGEVKRSSLEIIFKKRPRINDEFIRRFYDVRKTLVSMSDTEAKKYIRDIKIKKKK